MDDTTLLRLASTGKDAMARGEYDTAASILGEVTALIPNFLQSERQLDRNSPAASKRDLILEEIGKIQFVRWDWNFVEVLGRDEEGHLLVNLYVRVEGFRGGIPFKAEGDKHVMFKNYGY